jgi:PWWP domain
MPEPNDLDHCSISPSETRPGNPEDPLDVEEETNLETNTENEIKTEMKTDSKTPKSRGRPNKKEKQKQSANPQTQDWYDRPVYSSLFQDETRNVFLPSDLVWGKVKSHPWWPGLIFDPFDASELALKHQNKNNFLVAYFFDNTFAWNETSMLKPFQSNFHRMVKQSSTDSFMSAVDEALAEVSRRLGSAFSCGCYNSGVSSAEAMFENAGVKANTASPSGDVLFIRRSFDPVKFLGFLCKLGESPYVGFESLDLVVAKSQLKAFNQSRGCGSDLPEFCFACAFEEETVNAVTFDRIYTRKRKFIDRESSKKPIFEKCVPEEEGTKKKKLSEIFNKKKIMRIPLNPCKVHIGGPSGSDNSGKHKKKRLDSLGDLRNKLRARRKYLRVGQCMRKAANQATPTMPTPKPNGITSRKRKRLSMIKDRVEKKPLRMEKSIVSSDNLSRDKSSRKKKEVLRKREEDEGSFSLDRYSSSSEMFSQLCLAARGPLKGYSFITMIYSFFTRFRGYVVSPSTSKRNRRRSIFGKFNLVEDDVRDSFLSDLAIDGNDNEKLITLCQKQKGRKGEKDNVLVGNSVASDAKLCEDLGNENQQEDNLGISDVTGHEPVPEVEDSMPTALVLNFKGTAPVRTRPEPNGLFTHFGPLKEAEIEVSEKENSTGGL